MHGFMLDVLPLIVAGGVLFGAWALAITVLYASIGFGENRAD